MKKLLLMVAVWMVSAAAIFGQSKSVEIYRNGNVIYSEFTSAIDSITFVNRMAAPTGVMATLSNGNTAITVTWGAVSGATSYEVYRSGNGTDFSSLAGNITATQYVDNNPLVGANYYRIKAQNASLSSALSAASGIVLFTGDDGSNPIYAGVVAFNRYAYVKNLTFDLNGIKSYISELTNTDDNTALCYAVSKSTTLFAAGGLPAFDKRFIVTFTDGYDNFSDAIGYAYASEGREVWANEVYDTAAADIGKLSDLHAYAIGMGNDAAMKENDTRKLLHGSGFYRYSATSSGLNDIFTEIANNIISNSKNFVLITQNVRIDDAHPKYFKIIIKSWATNNYSGASRSDTVICRLGTDRMLNIITPESNIGFTTPVQGTVDPQNDTKINIPLDNLSVTVGGNPYYFKNVEDEPIAVQVSDDNITYTVNAEAGKASSSISNKIAVVLVLDCSTSLGSAFTPLKTAANSFVDILKNAAEGQSGTGGGQAGSGTYTANGVSFDMIAVPGGTFSMGSTSGEANEQPVHSVTLSNFSIGKYEVTQQLWLAVMGNWPSTAPSSTYGNGNNYPAYYVSWQDIVGTSSSQAGYTVNGVTYYQNGFCYKLSLLVGSGLKFCLPTEAQWEYAAKGGQQSHNYTYSGSNTIGDVAWYDGNRSGGSHPVGTKAANELGIYDMSGNVWEWCSDWYGSYGSGAQTNPAGASSGTYRVYRGGSWRISASNCRVAARYYYLPGDRYYDFGFRLACSSN